MLPIKVAHFPRFRSPANSSQRNGPKLHRTELPCPPQSETGEGKGAKSRRKKANSSVLKVKLAKVSHIPPVTQETPRRLTLEPVTPKTYNQGSGTNLALVEEDVYLFSPRSQTKTTNEKDKARLSVLRTISRMLEENVVIRRRLDVLTQAR